MNEFVLLGVLCAGGGLGLLFFFTLAWCVRLGLRRSHMILWFLCCCCLRFSVLCWGLYWLAGGDYLHWLVALLGLLSARWYVLSHVRVDTSLRGAN